MQDNFGAILRQYRLRSGYGLRRFAKLIGEMPSNLSAVETGGRSPWRQMEKLRKVANALALEEGSRDWDRFFLAACKPEILPPDVERLLERELNIALLRTVDELKLSDDELTELVDHVRAEWAKKAKAANGRKNSRRRAR